MGQISLSIKYAKNTGAILSPAELKSLYFTGIPLQDQLGNPIPNETVEFMIEAAQKEVQDVLSVKFERQAYLETRDYMYDDWIKWGFIPTTYPVVTPYSLKGYLNTTLQINYPQEWLSSKRQSKEEDLYHRSVNLVPIQGSTSAISGGSVYVGIAPLIGQWGNRSVPHYWTNIYITGFNKIPADILNYIGKKAAISLCTQVQDIILGVGVASKSLSIDGVSQSLSTTASAMYGLFSAKINQYDKELEKSMPLLKARYQGFSFGVLG